MSQRRTGRALRRRWLVDAALPVSTQRAKAGSRPSEARPRCACRIDGTSAGPWPKRDPGARASGAPPTWRRTSSPCSCALIVWRHCLFPDRSQRAARRAPAHGSEGSGVISMAARQAQPRHGRRSPCRCFADGVRTAKGGFSHAVRQRGSVHLRLCNQAERHADIGSEPERPHRLVQSATAALAAAVRSSIQRASAADVIARPGRARHYRTAARRGAGSLARSERGDPSPDESPRWDRGGVLTACIDVLVEAMAEDGVDQPLFVAEVVVQRRGFHTGAFTDGAGGNGRVAGLVQELRRGEQEAVSRFGRADTTWHVQP